MVHARRLRDAVLTCLLASLCLLEARPSQAAPPAPAPTAVRYFPATGHTLRGRFRQYWESHGGLVQQGYPLSEEFAEVNLLDGQTYTVQYFERARFEYHPENAGTPYEVLLAQLGTFRYHAQYPTGAPNQQPAEAGTYYVQTGHTLGGKFRAYWVSHGGLAQQGYPLSDGFVEVSPLNGKAYFVQYFERAIFELHVENRPPYDVLQAQLGRFELDHLYPRNSNPAAVPIPSPGTETPGAAPATWPPRTGTETAPLAGPGSAAGVLLPDPAGPRRPAEW